MIKGQPLRAGHWENRNAPDVFLPVGTWALEGGHAVCI